jgi:hypothetical protein
VPGCLSCLLLDTPFASQCHSYAQTYSRSPTCLLSTYTAGTGSDANDHAVQMHDELDDRRETAARVAVHEEVTALNTLGIDATSLGLPPQGVVVWQVDELYIYAIGACWIKLLALVAGGTYSNQRSLTKLGREIDQVGLN